MQLKLTSENIRTDYPGNTLFYRINRIPPSEENYIPGLKFLRRQIRDQIQLLGKSAMNCQPDHNFFECWSKCDLFRSLFRDLCIFIS